MERQQLIQNSIISDLAEGVMAVRFDGMIELVNDAALEILGRRRGELVGKSFALAFLDEEANDAFVQSVLDAIYQKGKRQESYVPYCVGAELKQLRIVSSFLRNGEDVIGVILVISDITELTEMRDAIRAMETIRGLNQQLELRNRLLQETFGRYLSDDIVKEILDSPDGWKLGGRKETLTIMMSDVRGFTMLCERMEPHNLLEMLNHYFGEMYAEINACHGTLIEFLGDGMLVIFGAPMPNEKHASDAVTAAVKMQNRMEAVNAWNRERGYPELAMGIGINTDSVIIGNIGSEKRTKYGVLGAAVNLTGRIESYTTGGQILISSETRDAIEEELKIRRDFMVQPKGVRREICLTEVEGIGDLRLQWSRRDETDSERFPKPVKIRFYRMDGKHVDDKPVEGEIYAASEQEMMLQTEAELNTFDNLRIDIGRDLYAKVMDGNRDRYRLSITARPDGFHAWLAAAEAGRTESGEAAE